MIDLSNPRALKAEDHEALAALSPSQRTELTERIREQVLFLAAVLKAAGIEAKGAVLTTKVQTGGSGLDEWLN